jgi:hypothetical protein
MHPPFLSCDWLTATRRSDLQWVHCLQLAASLHCSMFATSVCFCSHDSRFLFCFFWFHSSGTTCHTRLRRTNCVIHCRGKVYQLCLSASLRGLLTLCADRDCEIWCCTAVILLCSERNKWFYEHDGPFSLLYLFLPPSRKEIILCCYLLPVWTRSPILTKDDVSIWHWKPP